uniref:acylphosphatase n=1 Tax=Rhizochromulina marina TaxID=1034831 RepID=A0A7S2WHN9_9STRA
MRYTEAAVGAGEEPLDVAFDGPPGWRMVDRFAGFRYEAQGSVVSVGYSEAAAVKAEALGCFGWAQSTARGSVVGEARCAKSVAPVMKEWLEQGNPESRVDSVTFKDYENTKIKLHFSHFKILPEERETCFRDPPHQCAEFQEPNGGSSGAPTGSRAPDEL